jgi:hypothetical protein
MEESLKKFLFDGCAMKNDSILDYLRRREVGLQMAISNIPCSTGLPWRQDARKQYTKIPLNETLYEQDLNSFIRRFSPSSGRYLIGFSRTSQSVLIYTVNYHSIAKDWTDLLSQPVQVLICKENENLCRDFALFTPDESFVSIHDISNRPFKIYSNHSKNYDLLNSTSNLFI